MSGLIDSREAAMSFSQQAKQWLIVSCFWLLGFGGIDNAVVRHIVESAPLGPAWPVFALPPPWEAQRTS